MYCFEAHKCSRYDCPVQRKQIMRCWQYLEAALGRPVEKDDCPYAPCDHCNYRLGWEIGLIVESMFPEIPDPTPESLLPDISPAEKNQTEPPQEPDKTEPEVSLQVNAAEELLNSEKIGTVGMRFCHELLECPNPNCTVRVQQIFECYKYFSRRSPEDKQKLTCTDRTCDQCFYKRGWDLGILNESLFSDIIDKKKLALASADRVKRNTLVEMYLSELSKKPLSREEEYALARKIAGDHEASELFLLANLKLVTRVAKKFSGGSLPLMDLIQEGNMGLIKAIARFDHTLGYKFSTYAAYWIRYYMQKAVATQGSSIRIPHHLLTVAHKIRRHIQEFENQFFRSPSISELSEILGMEKEKILNVLNITQTPVSIHAGTSSDDENNESMEYYLADKKNLSPEETALENFKNEAVHQGLAKLPERLRFIIEKFYGFSDEELSLAEIGRRMDISRERVRQLLHQALKLLQKEEAIVWHYPE